jgi:hypothetical protein
VGRTPATMTGVEDRLRRNGKVSGEFRSTPPAPSPVRFAERPNITCRRADMTKAAPSGVRSS